MHWAHSNEVGFTSFSLKSLKCVSTGIWKEWKKGVENIEGQEAGMSVTTRLLRQRTMEAVARSPQPSPGKPVAAPWWKGPSHGLSTQFCGSPTLLATSASHPVFQRGPPRSEAGRGCPGRQSLRPDLGSVSSSKAWRPGGSQGQEEVAHCGLCLSVPGIRY